MKPVDHFGSCLQVGPHTHVVRLLRILLLPPAHCLFVSFPSPCPPACCSGSQGRALLLRRLDPASAAWRLLPVLSAVGGALDEAAAGGAISAAQRQALGELLARRLGAGQPV